MSAVLKPKVPEGLRDLMKALTREILKEKPADIYDFAENYFHARLPDKENYAVNNFEQTSEKYKFSYQNNSLRCQLPVALVHSVMVPEGLTSLLKELITSILREQPQNLCEFAVEYFRHLKSAKTLTKDIHQTTYEDYFIKNERFLFTSNLRCTCGRILSNSSGTNGLKVAEVNLSSKTPIPTKCFVDIDGNNATHSKRHMTAIYKIKKYLPHYLRKKNATTKSNKLSPKSEKIFEQPQLERCLSEVEKNAEKQKSTYKNNEENYSLLTQKSGFKNGPNITSNDLLENDEKAKNYNKNLNGDILVIQRDVSSVQLLENDNKNHAKIDELNLDKTSNLDTIKLEIRKGVNAEIKAKDVLESEAESVKNEFTNISKTRRSIDEGIKDELDNHGHEDNAKISDKNSNVNKNIETECEPETARNESIPADEATDPATYESAADFSNDTNGLKDAILYFKTHKNNEESESENSEDEIDLSEQIKSLLLPFNSFIEKNLDLKLDAKPQVNKTKQTEVGELKTKEEKTNAEESNILEELTVKRDEHEKTHAVIEADGEQKSLEPCLQINEICNSITHDSTRSVAETDTRPVSENETRPVSENELHENQNSLATKAEDNCQIQAINRNKTDMGNFSKEENLKIEDSKLVKLAENINDTNDNRVKNDVEESKIKSSEDPMHSKINCAIENKTASNELQDDANIRTSLTVQNDIPTTVSKSYNPIENAESSDDCKRAECDGEIDVQLNTTSDKHMDSVSVSDEMKEHIGENKRRVKKDTTDQVLPVEEEKKEAEHETSNDSVEQNKATEDQTKSDELGGNAKNDIAGLAFQPSDLTENGETNKDSASKKSEYEGKIDVQLNATAGKFKDSISGTDALKNFSKDNTKNNISTEKKETTDQVAQVVEKEPADNKINCVVEKEEISSKQESDATTSPSLTIKNDIVGAVSQASNLTENSESNDDSSGKKTNYEGETDAQSNITSDKSKETAVLEDFSKENMCKDEEEENKETTDQAEEGEVLFSGKENTAIEDKTKSVELQCNTNAGESLNKKIDIAELVSHPSNLTGNSESNDGSPGKKPEHARETDAQSNTAPDKLKGSVTETAALEDFSKENVSKNEGREKKDTIEQALQVKEEKTAHKTPNISVVQQNKLIEDKTKYDELQCDAHTGNDVAGSASHPSNLTGNSESNDDSSVKKTECAGETDVQSNTTPDKFKDLRSETAALKDFSKENINENEGREKKDTIDQVLQVKEGKTAHLSGNSERNAASASKAIEYDGKLNVESCTTSDKLKDSISENDALKDFSKGKRKVNESREEKETVDQVFQTKEEEPASIENKETSDANTSTSLKSNRTGNGERNDDSVGNKTESEEKIEGQSITTSNKFKNLQFEIVALKDSYKEYIGENENREKKETTDQNRDVEDEEVAHKTSKFSDKQNKATENKNISDEMQSQENRNRIELSERTFEIEQNVNKIEINQSSALNTAESHQTNEMFDIGENIKPVTQSANLDEIKYASAPNDFSSNEIKNEETTNRLMETQGLLGHDQCPKEKKDQIPLNESDHIKNVVDNATVNQEINLTKTMSEIAQTTALIQSDDTVSRTHKETVLNAEISSIKNKETIHINPAKAIEDDSGDSNKSHIENKDILLEKASSTGASNARVNELNHPLKCLDNGNPNSQNISKEIVMHSKPQTEMSEWVEHKSRLPTVRENIVEEVSGRTCDGYGQEKERVSRKIESIGSNTTEGDQTGNLLKSDQEKASKYTSQSSNNSNDNIKKNVKVMDEIAKENIESDKEEDEKISNVSEIDITKQLFENEENDRSSSPIKVKKYQENLNDQEDHVLRTLEDQSLPNVNEAQNGVEDADKFQPNTKMSYQYARLSKTNTKKTFKRQDKILQQSSSGEKFGEATEEILQETQQDQGNEANNIPLTKLNTSKEKLALGVGKSPEIIEPLQLECSQIEPPAQEKNNSEADSSDQKTKELERNEVIPALFTNNETAEYLGNQPNNKQEDNNYTVKNPDHITDLNQQNTNIDLNPSTKNNEKDTKNNLKHFEVMNENKVLTTTLEERNAAITSEKNNRLNAQETQINRNAMEQIKCDENNTVGQQEAGKTINESKPKLLSQFEESSSSNSTIKRANTEVASVDNSPVKVLKEIHQVSEKEVKDKEILNEIEHKETLTTKTVASPNEDDQSNTAKLIKREISDRSKETPQNDTEKAIEESKEVAIREQNITSEKEEQSKQNISNHEFSNTRENTKSQFEAKYDKRNSIKELTVNTENLVYETKMQAQDAERKSAFPPVIEQELGSKCTPPAGDKANSNRNDEAFKKNSLTRTTLSKNADGRKNVGSPTSKKLESLSALPQLEIHDDANENVDIPKENADNDQNIDFKLKQSYENDERCTKDHAKEEISYKLSDEDKTNSNNLQSDVHTGESLTLKNNVAGSTKENYSTTAQQIQLDEPSDSGATHDDNGSQGKLLENEVDKDSLKDSDTSGNKNSVAKIQDKQDENYNTKNHLVASQISANVKENLHKANTSEPHSNEENENPSHQETTFNIGIQTAETFFIGAQNLTIDRYRNFRESLVARNTGPRFAETHLRSFWKEYVMNNSEPLSKYKYLENEPNQLTKQDQNSDLNSKAVVTTQVSSTGCKLTNVEVSGTLNTKDIDASNENISQENNLSEAEETRRAKAIPYKEPTAFIIPLGDFNKRDTSKTKKIDPPQSENISVELDKTTNFKNFNLTGSGDAETIMEAVTPSLNSAIDLNKFESSNNDVDGNDELELSKPVEFDLESIEDKLLDKIEETNELEGTSWSSESRDDNSFVSDELLEDQNYDEYKTDAPLRLDGEGKPQGGIYEFSKKDSADSDQNKIMAAAKLPLGYEPFTQELKAAESELHLSQIIDKPDETAHPLHDNETIRNFNSKNNNESMVENQRELLSSKAIGSSEYVSEGDFRGECHETEKNSASSAGKVDEKTQVIASNDQDMLTKEETNQAVTGLTKEESQMSLKEHKDNSNSSQNVTVPATNREGLSFLGETIGARPEDKENKQFDSPSNSKTEKPGWFIGDQQIVPNDSLAKTITENPAEEMEAYIELTTNPAQYSAGSRCSLESVDASGLSRSPTAPISDRSRSSVDVEKSSLNNICKDTVAAREPSADGKTAASQADFEGNGLIGGHAHEDTRTEEEELAEDHLQKTKTYENNATLKCTNLTEQFMNSERQNSGVPINSKTDMFKSIKFVAPNTEDISKILSDFTNAEKSLLSEECLEEPCIKKRASNTGIPEEEKALVTTTESSSVSEIDETEDSLSTQTVKLEKPSTVISKMQQRRDSTTKISSLEKRKDYSFDEPRIVALNSFDTDEEGIVVKKLQREETLDSSTPSDTYDVIIGAGENDKALDSFEAESTLPLRGSLKRVYTIAGESDAKLLYKNVTIDESIRYIEPPDVEVTSGKLGLDSETNENILRKMMAYSLSESDSDCFNKSLNYGKSTSEVTGAKYDDFNVSTALLDTENSSSETDYAVISRVTITKTQKPLEMATTASKSTTLGEPNQTSYENAAVDEFLKRLVQESAATKVQKFYRAYLRTKTTKTYHKPNESLASETANISAQKRSCPKTCQSCGSSSKNNSKAERSEIVSSEAESKKSIGNSAKKKYSATLTGRTAVEIQAKKRKENKLKWFAMRQNSMPVQIDSEVLRVIPKYMRKKIKSADGEKKKSEHEYT